MFNPMGQSNPEDLGNGGTIDGDITITGDLQVQGGISLSVDEVIQGTSTIDVTNTEALLVRKNNDGGDVFVVDTTNSGVGITGNVTITTADNTDTLTLISTDADATAGAYLNIYRNSGSPADNDQIGQVTFSGRNDNSQDVDYARIITQIKDASDGTELGRFAINTMVSGGMYSRVNIMPTETVFNDESVDLDFRVESDANTHAFFVQGSSSNIGISNSSPASALTIDVADGQNKKGLHITQNDAGEWTSMMEAQAYGLLVRSTANDTTPALKIQGNGTSNEVLTALSNGKVGIGTSSVNGVFTAQGTPMTAISAQTVADIFGNVQQDADKGGGIGLGGRYITNSNSVTAFAEISGVKANNTSANYEGEMVFKTRVNGGNLTERMRIDGSGNVIVNSGSAIQFGDSSYKIIGSTAGNYLRFYTESTQALQIDDSQNATFSGDVTTSKANATGNSIILKQSLGSIASPSTSADTNILGKIQFVGKSSNDTPVGAEIKSVITASVGSAKNMPASLVFSTQPPGGTDLTTALTIDTSQNATFANTAIFANNKSINFLNTSGAEKAIISFNSSNITKIGDSSNSGTLQLNSGNATFAGNVTVNGSTTTPMTISADTDKVFTLSSGVGETGNVPTIQTINTAGSALVGFGVRASVINLVTGSAKRLVLDDNSRISLSNNDSGGTGGSDSTSGNTLLGWRAGIDIASGGLNNTLFGHASGFKLTTGDDNTSFGKYAGLGNLTGSANTFIGSQSGLSDNGSSHSNNTAIGKDSLYSITVAGQNVAVGRSAGYSITDHGNNVFVGDTAGYHQTGESNVFIGKDAGLGASGSSAQDGIVAIGKSALSSLTTGGRNLAIGYQSLDALTEAFDNIAIGYDALGASSSTQAHRNIAIGTEALKSLNSNGQENIAIGKEALKTANHNDVDGNIAIGNFVLDAVGTAGVWACVGIGYNALTEVNNAGAVGSTAIGYSSLSALTSGASNTAVGFESLKANQQGDYNTAIGYEALESNIDGGDNTAVGYRALAGLNVDSSDTSASYNTAVGARALDGVTNGTHNTVIGADAMGSADGGETENTAIGYKAGFNINNGTNNICIGSNSLLSAVNGTNQIVIGKDTTGVADNSVTLGNVDTTQVYVAPHASNGGATQQLVFRDDADKGIINYDHNNGMFKITVEGTEHSRFASGGDLVLLHGGVNFLDAEGTSASSDANTLDDYEEGTWTPVFKEGANTLTFPSGTAVYTKIGNMVHLSYGLSDQTTSGTVSGTGQFQIQGLPFAPKNGITHVGSVIEYGGGVTFSGDGLVYVVGAGTGSNTILNLYQRNDAQAIQNANITGVGANTYFSFQISYPV